MKIYFAHSKKFDFIKEYYLPMQNNNGLKKETLLFPHQNDNSNQNERSFYSNLDLFIAEVSYPATGMGIELGFASDDHIPIYCFYKKGTKPSSSLKCITNAILEYTTPEELADKVAQIVNKYK